MRTTILWLVTATAAMAQTLEPVKLETVCTEEEMNSFGLSCPAEEPCPIYLELAAVEWVNTRLILAGNFHTANITLSSIILVSEDGGKTFTEPFPRIKMAALDAMQFIDFERGWISGQLVQSYAKDPFFLLTTDGGKNWRNVPLFGESRAGSVDKFYFDSRNHGAMLMDRGTSAENGGRWGLYESMTSGASWELKQVTVKKPEWKKSAPPSSDWRLTAVAKTKLYRVERRSGTKWEAAAEFKIEAGECKLADRAPSLPPTEAAEEKPAEPAASGVLVVPLTSPRKTPPKKKK